VSDGREPDVLVEDASRRTRLANERTQLAWWRTGLTALAVALGVGRVVPELGDATHQWPYELLGLAFALYGVALIGFGSLRGHHVDAAMERGGYAELPAWMSTSLAAVGALLGLAIAVLIVVG
jgi:putative membrane protein